MLILGLSGTGHCIGMCGPLIIAFPGKSGGIASHLCYHAGRLATYTVVGILMGTIGIATARIASAAGFDYMAILARLQILLSLVAGIFLFAFGLVQLGILGSSEWWQYANPEKLPGYRILLKSVYKNNNLIRMGFTGIFMGFLPCGLSFAAFSRALAASHPLEGGILTFAFGIGTLPGLLLIGTGASVLSRRYQKHFDLISGMLMIGMAFSLLVDGLAAML